MVKLPSMVLMVGPWAAYIAAAQWHWVPSRGAAGAAWFVPLFFGGFVLGWLVWSVQVPKWRLWAYPRVESIVALKRAAVATQLLWPDGHWFAKTEIMSLSVRAQLRALEAADAERHLARLTDLGETTEAN